VKTDGTGRRPYRRTASDSLGLAKEQEATRQGRLDALRSEIEHGATSGPGISGDQVFANARQRIADIAAGAANS
jgi:antitoxin ParD1/3/4